MDKIIKSSIVRWNAAFYLVLILLRIFGRMIKNNLGQFNDGNDNQ